MNENKSSVLLLFDFDGVLVDSKQAYLKQMEETIYILSKKRIDPTILLARNGNSDQIGDFEEFLETSDPEKLKQAKELYDSLTPKYEKMRRPFPDVIETLEFLHGNYTMGIISRKSQKRLDYWVDYFQLRKYFVSIIGTLEPTKANAITKVIQELGAERSHTLFVGDTEFDIRSGKEAGVKVVAALYDATEPEKMLELKPDYVINKFSEIKSIITQLET